MQSPRKVTMRDVARQAQVALSTVSNVINNQANVAPETRERVLNAARELGYGQSRGQMRTLGVVSKRQTDEDGNPAYNPVYSLVLHGIDIACQAAGIHLMYTTIEADIDSAARGLPPLLLENQVDGLILVGPNFTEPIGRIVRQPAHSIVLVDAYAPDEALYDSVVPSGIAGMRLAVGHLIEHGHRHIGLIGTRPSAHPSIRRRRDGYLLTLAENGISDIYIEDGALGDELEVSTATRRLLQRAPQITAIAAANDETALQVARFAPSLGRSIPESLSLVGYDDSHLALSMRPMLTTVRYDPTWLGRLAVEALLERAENPDRPPMTCSPKPLLIERASVRII
ncbi:MAG TPA: LacI family DNA-binding transcriptional regulator [Candidatus Limnocylindrales bacterium]|nr:LacI family DNA-binding transcriptional regulator [Candidatus Limnocylindrales bacterium]